MEYSKIIFRNISISIYAFFLLQHPRTRLVLLYLLAASHLPKVLFVQNILLPKEKIL